MIFLPLILNRDNTIIKIFIFLFGLALCSPINAKESNLYLENVSPVIESMLAFPREEFSLPESVLLELDGDYSEFPAGALAKKLLTTLQDNQENYFDLDFSEWVEANETLFKLDDYVSKNSEYGNALIKTYLNSLWLTSGYRWLNGDVLDNTREVRFSIDGFISHWKQVRFHLIDIEAMSYIYYKDILRIDLDAKPTPLESEVRMRSLNAGLDSYDYHKKGISDRYLNEFGDIAQEVIRANRDRFPSQELYQRVLTDQYFRKDYFLKLLNEKHNERFRVANAKYSKAKGVLELVPTHLDIPHHQVILATAESRAGSGKPYQIYLNLLIKAQLIKRLGLSFQDWPNLDYGIYLEYCRPDVWCSPKVVKTTEMRKAMIKNQTILGTQKADYLGLIGVLNRIKATHVGAAPVSK